MYYNNPSAKSDEVLQASGHGNQPQGNTKDMSSSDIEGGPQADRADRRRQILLQIGLLSGCLLGGCCIAIMIPFFPLEAFQRGLSQTDSSIVFSSYALTQLLAFPVAGRLVPRLGVKRSFSAGLALAGTTTVVFGLLEKLESARAFLGLSVAMRVGEAMGSSCLHTSARTLAATEFAGGTSGAFGLMETAIALGMSVGQGLGGLLYSLGGYGTPFYVIGCGMISIAITDRWFLGKKDYSVVKTTEKAPAGWLKRQAACLETWLIILVVVMVSMSWTMIDPNLSPWVKSQLSMNPSELSVYLLCSTGVYSLSSIVWGRVADRTSNVFVIIASGLLLAAVGVTFMLPAPFTGLAPSRVLFGVGFFLRQVGTGGAYVPAVGSFLACQSDVSGKAAAASCVGSFFAAGYIVGPILGGRIADLYGMTTAGTVQSCLNLVSAVLVGVYAARFQCKARSQKQNVDGL